MIKRLGKQTVKLQSPPTIAGFASVAGEKEGEGPLKNTFDYISGDSHFGEKTWEKAESAMLKKMLRSVLRQGRGRAVGHPTTPSPATC
jgi:stage V sporulation protein AD